MSDQATETAPAAIQPDYICPHCGKHDQLEVVVHTTRALTQTREGGEWNIDTSDDSQCNNDHEWDDGSRMDCNGCGFSSTAWRFTEEGRKKP